MKCTFQVGQRVVCIYDTWRTQRVFPDGSTETTRSPERGPEHGEVCVVTEVGLPVQFMSEPVCLRLRGFSEWYTHEGFRPLNERPKETSIDVFRKLLDGVKSNTHVNEDA